MSLAIATTSGTLAPAVPAARNADGSVSETPAAPYQGALADLNLGQNLAQEIDDFVRVLCQNTATATDPWAMKLAVARRLHAQIQATAELTSTRVVP
jgi:hypothetical protein